MSTSRDTQINESAVPIDTTSYAPLAQQYRLVLDELRELVRVCDPVDHQVLYMNAAARRAYGSYFTKDSKKCFAAFYGRSEPCVGCATRTDPGFLSGSYVDQRDSKRYFIRSCMMQWEGKAARLAIAVDADSEEGKWVDNLTGVGSRAAFYRDITSSDTSVGLAIVDVDGMSAINEQFGRVEGDRVLSRIANKLADMIGGQNVYRIGDDEFAVVVYGDARAEFVARAMDTARSLDKEGLAASLGYAWEHQPEEIATLVYGAVRHMRQAKRARALSRTTGWDPLLESSLSSLLQPQGAAAAVLAGDFVVWMQPQVDPSTRCVIGAEALVRYVDSITGAMIPPYIFIGPLEDMGEIADVDFFVFDRVCATTAKFERLGITDCRLSANFSRRTIEAPNFADRVEEIAAAYGVNSVSIEIEVTESAREADPEGLGNIVSDLRHRGFPVAIDDFGTDNANLSLFSTLEFDVLKLDKCLIDNVVDNVRVRRVIESVMRMCAELGIESVAEGVEKQDQLDVMRAAGCTRIQGYLTGRPMPLPDFEKLVLESPAISAK